jgi:hypothetical protein
MARASGVSCVQAQFAWPALGRGAGSIPTRHGGAFGNNGRAERRFSWQRINTFLSALSRGPKGFAMSKPITVTASVVSLAENHGSFARAPFDGTRVSVRSPHSINTHAPPQTACLFDHLVGRGEHHRREPPPRLDTYSTIRLTNSMDTLSGVLSALSHPSGRAMIARLAGGSARVTDIAEPFGMSLNAVSKHLKSA